jgi:predicted anti-sigma-YlaC factor YlaD
MTTKADIMPPAEMTCKELVELVTEYLDETLPPLEKARFEDHLAVCPYCRTYLDQMKQTISVLGKLTEESIAPQTREELLQLFRNWKQN